MVHLCGSAESAEVLLDNEGSMYFKPTCVGTLSERTYGFKNVSRIPLRFQWNIDFADRNVLKVEPASGVIQPNQSLVCIMCYLVTVKIDFCYYGIVSRYIMASL